MKNSTLNFLKFKDILFVVCALLLSLGVESQNVVITDDASYVPSSTTSLLEIFPTAGTGKGILIPRLTTAERTGMSPHATNDIGLLVFDETTKSFWHWDGSSWVEFTTAKNGLRDIDLDTKIQVEEAADEDKIRFDTQGSERMIIDENGDVGIGISVPNEQLEITGNFRMPATTATTGIIYSASKELLHTHGGITNAFFGVYSGVHTSGLRVTGGNNVGHGYYSLWSLTTGNSNIGLGRNAGGSTTEGKENVYIGTMSGTTSILGSGNVFLGYHSGRYETGSNKLYIENSSANSTAALIYGEFDNDLVRINGTLHYKKPLKTVAAATYTTLVTDNIIHVTYTSSGAVTITLESNAAVSGFHYIIKDAGGNAGTNNITINTEGAETIDGAASTTISTNYANIHIYSDGTNWFIY